MNLLVLSPHRDDAAFSLSLSIRHWLDEGHSVVILNIFTLSRYAPCDDVVAASGTARLDYVSQLRRREDEEFVARIDGRIYLLDLNLEDAPIRLGCDTSHVCEMEVDPNDEAIPQIRHAIENWLHSEHSDEDSALIVPLALGHHIDHRVVRMAALPLTKDIPTAFYEDLPYAMRAGAMEELLRFRGDVKTEFHRPLRAACGAPPCATSIGFKRRLISAYKSQIDSELMDSIADFSDRYGGTERLWVNSKWLDAAEGEWLSTGLTKSQMKPLPA